MGEIVAAAVVGHQPAIMAPEELRRRLGGGQDTSLVAGFATMRAALDRVGVDTWIIFDTHWFTTVEHVVGGLDHYAGVYTSEELPTLIEDLVYDYPGAPDLAAAVSEVGRERRVRVVNATNPHVAVHYPTLNVIHHMHRGEKVLSVATCQTAQAHNFLDLGAVIAAAVERVDGRVALLGSGGMSHTFWPLDEIKDHASFRPEDVISPEAAAMDAWILDRWAVGDHEAVIGDYPEIRTHHPEGFFAHYLTLVGALGGAACEAKGTPMSEYENAVGTGQVHVWFDVPAAGVHR
jgi:3,4-dihydroxyphenylacetate 2,3-dioxygenase